jgi:flagellar biosynthesis/type III secretory pathway M-ring protein FliF/YscJ
MSTRAKWIIGAVIVWALVRRVAIHRRARNDQRAADVELRRSRTLATSTSRSSKRTSTPSLTRLWRHEETKAAKAESIRAVSDTIGQFAETLRDTADDVSPALAAARRRLRLTQVREGRR